MFLSSVITHFIISLQFPITALIKGAVETSEFMFCAAMISFSSNTADTDRREMKGTQQGNGIQG